MAQKPTDLPEWASDPGADKAAPPSGKKETGWEPLEKPPHQWFNWFQNLVYQWLDYLKDYSSNHIHDGGSGDLSAPKVDLDDISAGDNAELEVSKDTPNNHNILYSGAAETTFTADILAGLKEVITLSVFTSEIRARIGDIVNVYNSSGSQLGVLIAGILTATESVTAPNVPKAIILFSPTGTSIGTPFNATISRKSGESAGVYIIEFDTPPADVSEINLQLTVNATGGNADASEVSVRSYLVNGVLEIYTTNASGALRDARVSAVAYWS